MDGGGPRREYFRLLLNEIAMSSRYFTGSESMCVPVHNILCLQDRSFNYIGQIVALSLLHDGPCPQFIAPAVVRYILADEELVSSDDIPDGNMQSKIKAVSCDWHCMLEVIHHH